MRISSANSEEVITKRAKLMDEKAERAEVRRQRAIKAGNKREADGAMRTIEEARSSAKRLRAQIGK